MLDRVQDPADVVVGLGKVAGVDLHHVGIELLLLGIERVPRRYPRAALGQLRVGRHDAQFLLPREGLLAHLVPALVELALVFRDPLLLRLMRGVRRARRVVEEERLVGRHGLLVADPLDGLVGDVVVEVVVRVAQVRLDGLGPVEDGGPPLAGLAADEPVEVLEAQAGRPEVERPGLAVLPVGHVVVLAEPGGVPALLLEDLGDRRGVLAHQAVVAGEARGQFHDDAGVHRVVIAPGEQRRARGRAERRGVELRVAQPVLGQPVQRRRVARPAEGARRADSRRRREGSGRRWAPPWAPAPAAENRISSPSRSARSAP